MEETNTLFAMFKDQWYYLLIAALIIAVTFFVKKKIPEKYENYCKGALVLTAVFYGVMAVLFKESDHFLLLPIIILCCELFGYGITGKVVSVLLADFVLINLFYRSPLAAVDEQGNDTLMTTIIFVALQLVTIIVAGIIMDKHIRKLQTEKTAQRLEDENGEKIIEEKPVLNTHTTEETDFMAKYSVDDIEEKDSVQSILDEAKNKYKDK